MWLHYENKLLYLVNITEPAGSLKIWGQSVIIQGLDGTDFASNSAKI